MAVLEHKQNPPETEKRSSAISVKNVLFATDFSATSESALPYATAISRRFGSMLHVVHVLSDASLLLMTGGVDYVSVGTLYEDAHSDAQEKIQRITTRLEGIPYRTYVRHGQVWTNLASIVKENAIDLIVVEMCIRDSCCSQNSAAHRERTSERPPSYPRKDSAEDYDD